MSSNPFKKHTIGEFVEHGPCPSCGSSDGLAHYDCGYVKCYAAFCDYYKYPNQIDNSTRTESVTNKSVKNKAPLAVEGHYESLREISKKTMEFMGYTIGEYQGQRAHLVAVPNADGKGHAATKVRLPNKQFAMTGNSKEAGLIFQDKWPANGKKLIITEGEFDALSVAEANGCKYPVVSLLNGAQSVTKQFKDAYKFIHSFDEIILWFDDDEAGQAAVEAAAEVCDIGKVKVIKTPLGYKDANALLQDGHVKAINDAVWQAEKYSPAGFVSLSSLKKEVLAPVDWGIPWIFPEITQWTYGRRSGETYFFGAGTGVGKTDFFTQQAAADVAAGRKVAILSFEQTPKEVAKRLAGKYAGKRFHIPDAGWDAADVEEAFRDLEDKGAYIYKHWGSSEWESVERDITVLAHAGYEHFYIDHMTAFAAHTQDEKKMLEGVCADMAGLCSKLGVNFYVISHLSTPEGTPHEEGGRVFIKHFKGSRAIGFWAHFMFGIERDTQAEDIEIRKRAKFRCLKDRYTGQATGKFVTMKYVEDTGLQEIDNEWVWEEDKPKKKTASDHGFDGRSEF